MTDDNKYKIFYLLTKDYLKSSTVEDMASLGELERAGLKKDFDDFTLRMSLTHEDSYSQIVQACNFAKSAQSFGINCSMFDSTKRCAAQNLKIFINDFCNKSLKTIWNNFQKILTSLRNIQKNMKLCHPKQNQKGKNLVHISEIISHLANKIQEAGNKLNNKIQFQNSSKKEIQQNMCLNLKQIIADKEKTSKQQNQEYLHMKLKLSCLEKEIQALNRNINDFGAKQTKLKLQNQRLKLQINQIKTNPQKYSESQKKSNQLSTDHQQYLRRQINTLSEQRQYYQIKLSQASTSNKHFQKAIEEIQQQLIIKCNEITLSKRRENQLMSQLQKYKIDNPLMKQKILCQVECERKKNQMEREQRNIQFQDLRRMLQISKISIGKKESLIEQLQKEKIELNQKLKSLSKKLEAEVMVNMEYLKQLVHDKQQLRKQITNLKQKLNIQEKQIEVLSGQLKNKQEYILQLQKQVLICKSTTGECYTSLQINNQTLPQQVDKIKE